MGVKFSHVQMLNALLHIYEYLSERFGYFDRNQQMQDEKIKKIKMEVKRFSRGAKKGSDSFVWMLIREVFRNTH